MGLNNQLNNFRKELLEKINDSQLPIGVVYYIVKDIFNDITTAYESAVLNELKEQAIQEAQKLQEEQKEDIKISEEN